MVIAPKDLPHKIRMIRLKMGQSQEEFGQRFNVTRQAVGRWEDGTAHPPMKVLKELEIEKVYVLGAANKSRSGRPKKA